jgi:hypothetical protein
MDEGRKISWHGRIISVQPRTRLMRSFDQRSHSYLGYDLRLAGTIGAEQREFAVAVGKAAHAKYNFKAGDEVSGEAEPVADERLETTEFYRASGIEVIAQGPGNNQPAVLSPPFLGVCPDLEVYRQRGHRRLDPRTYEEKCANCIWGCRMAVEMIIDQWNPSQERYRIETFCYGPKSCSFYKAGPTRKVPGRKGMSYTEEDWVDEDATSGRGPDD